MSRPYRVMADAGHGGRDPGAVNEDIVIEEDDVVLDIVRLFKRCVARGDYLYDVYLTRFSDRTLTLRERCKMAEEKKVNLFISFHLNSVEDKSVEGLEVWYKKASEKSKRLAAEIYRSLLVAMKGINGRGIKEGDFYVLRNVSMPAVLIEFEFLSNNQNFIVDIDDQRIVVRELAETIEDFLEGGNHE